MSAALLKTKFPFLYDATITWYPGHMAKATRIMKETLPKVNTILELRDARLPVSTANPNLQTLMGAKRRVVFLNHVDLCNPNITARHIEHITKTEKVPVITSDARNLTPKVLNLINKSCSSTDSTRILQVWLVCGLPNVGKSTLINSLIDKKKAPTSSMPGFTRGQTLYRMKNQQANALLLDTPGVMTPGVIEPIQGLRLALCGLIDSRVPGGDTLLASYLVYELNQRPAAKKKYYEAFDIPEHVIIDEFEQLSAYISLKTGKMDPEIAARQLLHKFRLGQLGQYTIDEVPTATTETE